jgi:nucleoid-associated protein YgaU
MTRFFRLGLVPLAFAAAASLRADDAAAPAPAAPPPASAASTPAPAEAAPAPQAAPPTEDAAALRSDNKQLTDELATAWKESDKLKADLAKSTAEAADLKTQLDAQKSQAAVPAPAANGGDANPQLAEVQDKLATALRSFSVIQNENSDLKAAVEKLTAENTALTQSQEAAKSQIATLQVQANATQQIIPLRNELRQSEDEINRLARENERLRNRVALMEPEPGAPGRLPTRPGSQTLAPEPVATTTPVPTPTPTPGRTYVIAEGDTLTRISRKFYGSSGHWEEILAANRDVIKNEKKLPVGDTIKIP